MAKKGEKYSEEFKSDAVRMMRNRGDRSVAEVADDLGVPQSALYRWAAEVDEATVAKRNDKGETLEDEVRRLRKENDRLRMEKAILKKAAAFFAKDNEYSYRFILSGKADFEVRLMCQVLGVSPSAYYEWEREQESQHARRDNELLELIRALFAQFRARYGAPRIHGELAKVGINVSRKRVARLMREAGIRGKGARKYKATTDSKHSLPVAPNLLERQFTVEARNEVWVSDITYLWTRQGWMYLAVIIDLFSRRVVGWSLSERMTADLVCSALDSAVSKRQPGPGLLVHSDRGSQYASRAFRRRLWRYRMVQSMSRKGNCWDNAVAESFFATLKKELVRDYVFESRAAARSAVFEYIEVFYNRQRAHSLLSYATPTSFEACTENTTAA